MQLSIFEVLGPVMIGPSSSHTAGAARLGRVAAVIASKPFHLVRFGLSGSFAKTGVGHGTRKALLAGVLGLAQDDERIREIEHLAAERRVKAEYYDRELDNMHENSASIAFFHDDGSQSEIWGSSTGGGRIIITRINGLEMEITAESPTLVIPHADKPSVVSDISRVLAGKNINIAELRLSRQSKGKRSTVVIETDKQITAAVLEQLREVKHVIEVILVDVPQL